MKKIYMAGCGGMLGEAFYELFSRTDNVECSDIDVNSPWLSYLDFRDLRKYRNAVSEFKPDYLFHLGAHTGLEFCEEHADDAYATNTLAVESAVMIANELDIPILYISTAGIFDGTKPSYDDWDTPNPLGVYARSKFMGERFVMESARRYLVCRAGWMMGGGPAKDKKFIQKLMKQIKAGAKTIHVVDDKDGTPTYTHDFARNVQTLIDADLTGLYNTVCGGQTSRFEVAQELLSLLNLTDKVEIVAVSSHYFEKEYFAPRPPSERLLNRKLDIRGLNVMRHWRIALKEYLDTSYVGYFG